MQAAETHADDRKLGAERMEPDRRARVRVAIAIGIASFLVCWASLAARHIGAADFTWALGGASDLIHGHNPYTDPRFRPTNPYPHSDVIFYPLPALALAVPFLLFPQAVAGGLFVGIGGGLLAYAVTRDGWDNLPLFLSAPYITALSVAQWSPLMTAAALLPWLAPLLIAKPNLAVGMSAAWPRWRGLAAGFGVLLATALIAPRWTMNWLQNLLVTHHPVPILLFPGVILLLAVLRWRDPRARLLLGFAIIPQFFYFYDQLPLMLVARTRKQSAAMACMSWVAYWGWYVIGRRASGIQTPDSAPPWILAFLYLPALLVVLMPLFHRWKGAKPPFANMPARASRRSPATTPSTRTEPARDGA